MERAVLWHATVIICATIVGAVAMFNIGWWQGRIYEYERCTPIIEENMGLYNILNDPHHCVSVCQKEFEKYGC